MSEYRVDFSETLRYLGYRGQELDSDTRERIERASADCLKVSKPAYVYERFDFRVTDAGIELEGTGVTLRGEDIRRHLDGAKTLYLMAATLGHGCDRRVMRLEASSLADAVCFNAASVSLIESVSDACQHEINALHSSEGLQVGGRYSPGYGDFPLTQQRELLRLLRAQERIGITLTDGFLMLPRKSVTAVLGLYEDKPEEPVSCTVCAMRDFCEFRKGGEHCG